MELAIFQKKTRMMPSKRQNFKKLIRLYLYGTVGSCLCCLLQIASPSVHPQSDGTIKPEICVKGSDQ